MTTRYIVQSIAGPTKGEFLHWNLPLSDVKNTIGIGPWWLEANLSVDAADLGEILKEWEVAIWVEEDMTRIVGGGILTGAQLDENGRRKIVCTGYLAVPDGMIFDGDRAWEYADTMDVLRFIWDWVEQRSPLSFKVPTFKSGVTIGTEKKDVAFETQDGRQVSFQSNDGPFYLQWWESPNVGSALETLAKETPFEAAEHHYWDGDVIRHEMEIGIPRLGRRRDDLRFMLGENITENPDIEGTSAAYANEIIALGAGEGKTMKRVVIPNSTDALTRTAVVSFPAEKSTNVLFQLAQHELRKRMALPAVKKITVRDHPNAPIGSWRGGDEILVNTETLDGVKYSQWSRVLNTTIESDKPGIAVIELERSSG